MNSPQQGWPGLTKPAATYGRPNHRYLVLEFLKQVRAAASARKTRWALVSCAHNDSERSWAFGGQRQTLSCVLMGTQPSSDTEKGCLLIMQRLGEVGRSVMLSTAALLGGLIVGGCAAPAVSTSNPTPPRSTQSSQTSENSQSPQSTARTSTVDGTSSRAGAPTQQSTRCHTSMLRARLTPNSQGNGHVEYNLWLDNVSGQTCTIYGYAGMQLVGAEGVQLPTNLERTPNGGFVPPAAPTLVTVPPGEGVVAQFSYSFDPGPGEPATSCEPMPDHILITPPDERDPLTAQWDDNAGPACQQGAMTINAFQKGFQ